MSDQRLRRSTHCASVERASVARVAAAVAIVSSPEAAVVSSPEAVTMSSPDVAIVSSCKTFAWSYKTSTSSYKTI
eukprot:5758042-Pleurochrysis_carterae.AAC.1